MGKKYNLLKKLEWSAVTRGPGSTMGARDGSMFACCPICKGVRPGHSSVKHHFVDAAIGHKDDCEMARVLDCKQCEPADETEALETPVEWHEEGSSDGRSVLFYKLREDGWRKGKPIMVNDVTVRVELAPYAVSELNPVVDQIRSALNPPMGLEVREGFPAWAAVQPDGLILGMWAIRPDFRVHPMPYGVVTGWFTPKSTVQVG